MKKVFFTFLLTAGWMLSIFASPEYIITRDRINVRADSTVTSPSLGFLLKNDEVRILEETAEWSRVTLPERFSCYISKQFAQKINPTTVKVTGTRVNLRSAATLEAPIIGQSPEGATFPLRGEIDQWFKIQGHTYVSGWVHKKFIKEKPFDLSRFIKETLPALSEPDIKKKAEIHQALVENGEDCIPILERHLAEADDNTLYSLIIIFTRLGQNNPKLIPYFLKRIEPSELRISGVYLDVVQNILNPDNPKTAYFYRAAAGKLPGDDIMEAKGRLKEVYRQTIATQ